MNKLALYRWTIALLVVLNLTTIATIWIHNSRDKSEQESIVVDPVQNIRVNGRYFRQEIGFDNDQMQIFRNANRAFQPTARKLLAQLDSLKMISFEEINKQQPDTIQLNLIATEIGNCHSDLKRETHRFYLTILSISTAEQSEKIKATFTPLFRGSNCSPLTNQQQQNNHSIK